MRKKIVWFKSRVRELRKEFKMKVIFVCPKCKSHKTISKEQWLAGETPELCCGQTMVYHGEDKARVEIMERKL
jgi:hypothetical protein